MALIYCGIDEAGYGPMLGPLCVGFSAFRVEGWDPKGGAPDLWKLLDKAVCRKGRDSRKRIAVADSKKLKLPNDSKHQHPLVHLERGVLAFGGLVGEGGSEGVPRICEPCETLDTDDSLFAALGVHLEPHPWYAVDPTNLPLAGSAAQLAIARNKLALACEGAGVEPLALACIGVGETEFNETIRTGGSKAHCTGRCFVRYLRRVVERWGGTGDEVRLVCDRHGGRTSYLDMIEAGVRGLGEVETLEESDRCSRYAVHLTSDLSGGRAFQPAAPRAVVPHSTDDPGELGSSSVGETERQSPPPNPLPPGAGGGGRAGPARYRDLGRPALVFDQWHPAKCGARHPHPVPSRGRGGAPAGGAGVDDRQARPRAGDGEVQPVLVRAGGRAQAHGRVRAGREAVA